MKAYYNGETRTLKLNDKRINIFCNAGKRAIYGVDNVGSYNSDLCNHRTDDSALLSKNEAGYCHYSETLSDGSTAIHSVFDNIYPWRDMEEVEIGTDTFIKIPKFYSKITQNADGTYKHQLSGTKHDGFSTLFIDGNGNEIDYVLVGKYEAGHTTESINGVTQTIMASRTDGSVWRSVTMPTMRTAAEIKGAGYQLYDFLIHRIIQELFLIEFATTNAQSIMRGLCDLSSASNGFESTGRTNRIAAQTGYTTAANDTNVCGSFKYRGIENLWGNFYKWIDGIRFSHDKIYICTNPQYYSTQIGGGHYVEAGTRPLKAGWAKSIKYFDNFPLLGYASEVAIVATSIGANTHYCDCHAVQDRENLLLNYGGTWHGGDACGLWDMCGELNETHAPHHTTSRLCFKPI